MGRGVGDDDGLGPCVELGFGAGVFRGVGVGLLDGMGAVVAGPVGPPTIGVIVPSKASIRPLPSMPSAHAPVPRRCAALAARALSAMEDGSS